MHQIQSFSTLYLLSDFPLVKEIIKCMVLIAILSKYFIYNHTWNILCITFSAIDSRLYQHWLNSGRWQVWKEMRKNFYGGYKLGSNLILNSSPLEGNKLQRERGKQLAIPAVSQSDALPLPHSQYCHPNWQLSTAFFMFNEPQCNYLISLPMLAV